MMDVFGVELNLQYLENIRQILEILAVGILTYAPQISICLFVIMNMLDLVINILLKII